MRNMLTDICASSFHLTTCAVCVCLAKYMCDLCNLESHVLVEINAIITTCCPLQILDVSDIIVNGKA